LLEQKYELPVLYKRSKIKRNKSNHG